MRIFGAKFDSASNKACPHCGASFEGNDTIEAAQERQQKLDDLEMRQQQMELEERQSQIEYSRKQRQQVQRSQKRVKYGCIIPVFIFIAIGFIFTIGSVVFTFLNRPSEDVFYDDTDIIADFPEEDESEPLTTEVDFNVVAEMGDYTIVCDEIIETDRGGFKPAKGYMYVAFHFVMKNTSEESLSPFSTLICAVDGVVCEEKFLFDEKKFDPDDIPAGLSADGYICFEVPEDAERFELRHESSDGSSVTFYIDNTLS